MRPRSPSWPVWLGPAPRRLLRAVACAALLAAPCGCAASRPAADAATPPTATIDLRMARSLELTGSRGELRTLRSELRVEFRPAGARRGADAGVVTLGGAALVRGSAGKDESASTYYVLPDEALASLTRPGSDGWADLVAAGSPAFPPVATRVRLAPALDVVTPTPGVALPRSEPIEVRVAGLPAGLWARVSLGDGAATASDRGAGLWEFTVPSLATLPAGPARLRVEVETSCEGCAAGPQTKVRWFGRTEMDVALTLL